VSAGISDTRTRLTEVCRWAPGNQRYGATVDPDNDDERERTTALIQRDALLGLLDRSSADQPLAHTVSRDQLRSRAVTRNDIATAEAEPFARPVEPDPDDIDLAPSLSPLLVLAVITVLLVAFIAAMHLR
jgi:hypothetical protein